MSMMEQIDKHVKEQMKEAMLIESCNIVDAERAFNAIYGENIQCGFCSEFVEVDYTEIQGALFPVNFVWLPRGLIQNDTACHLCVDCLRVNRGITEEDKECIMDNIKARVKKGSNLEIALEQAVMTWCVTALTISGKSVEVRRAVRKQMEAFGEDGNVASYGNTQQASDLRAQSLASKSERKDLPASEAVRIIEDGEEVLKLG